MATISPLKFIYVSATQGSADAFVQAQFSTGLSGQTATVGKIREILWEMPNLGAVNLASAEFSITTKTQAAMPTLLDKSIIIRSKVQVNFGTSGMAVYENVRRFTFQADDDLLFVSDPLYFQFDTNATAAVNTGYLRIGYTLEKISEVDRLTLLANSLS